MIRRLAVAVPAALAVALTIRLVAAFLSDDFAFRIVAEQSRSGSPWYYRLAGTWASAQGSLLVFSALVGAVGWWGTRRSPRAAAVAAATTAVLLGIVLATASPFERLAVPAISGLGLTPILEHWAMAIHPPLLYLALAAGLPAFARFVAGEPDPAADRRSVLAVLSLTTVAMALGAYWSYAEQGWGGYWAWDPVENGSLAVWLAALVAVHRLPGVDSVAPASDTRAGRRAGISAGAAIVAAPWCVAVAESAASRSGAVPSVHSFAEAGRVGAALGFLALATIALAVASVLDRRAHPGADLAGANQSSWNRYPTLLGAAALVIVALGVATPFAARVIGTRLRVRGRFYAPLLAGLALTAVVLIAMLATTRVRARSTSGARTGPRAAAWLAHVGFAALVFGAFASTADRHASLSLASGGHGSAAGVSIVDEGVEVVPGPRPGTRAVRADLTVDGATVHPSLVVYPERGGILAETATVHGWWTDVQVALVRADDAGRVLLEVRRRPGMTFVWSGAAATAIGAGLSRRRARDRRTPATRRRRPAEPACERAAR